MVVLFIAALFSLIFAFILYYNRSTKEMPKNRREMKVEIWYQIYGILGFVEDLALRFQNKVGEL